MVYAPRLSPLARSGFWLLGLMAAAALFFHLLPLAKHRVAAEAFRWLLVGGMVTLYIHGYRALQASPPSARHSSVIVAFGAALCLLAVIVPAFNSIDVCCYINIGWQQVGYGINPHLHSVDEIARWRQDPMFRPYWQHQPCAYSFLFSRVARMVCELGAGDWWRCLYLFKGISVLAHGLMGWLVWLGCRRLQAPYPERALYLFLWNPLLLLHMIANGHNDGWMALLTGLAVFAALTDRWAAVIPPLLAAVLVKYAAIVVLPFAVLHLRRRHGWRQALVGLALGGATSLVLSWTYLPGNWSEWPLARFGANATALHTSLPALLYFPFEAGAKHWPGLEALLPQVASAIKLSFWLGFLVFCAALGWRRWRAPDYDAPTLVRDSVLVQFVLICLVSSKYYAWYLGMFFPLALWLPEGDRLRRTVLALSCAQMLSFTFVGQSHALNVLLMTMLPLVWALRRPFNLPGSASAAPPSASIAA